LVDPDEVYEDVEESDDETVPADDTLLMSNHDSVLMALEDAGTATCWAGSGATEFGYPTTRRRVYYLSVKLSRCIRMLKEIGILKPDCTDQEAEEKIRGYLENTREVFENLKLAGKDYGLRELILPDSHPCIQKALQYYVSTAEKRDETNATKVKRARARARDGKAEPKEEKWLAVHAKEFAKSGLDFDPNYFDDAYAMNKWYASLTRRQRNIITYYDKTEEIMHPFEVLEL